METNKIMEDHDGREFMCPVHGLDYRMTCERCNDCYERFMKVCTKIVKANQKEYARLDTEN